MTFSGSVKTFRADCTNDYGNSELGIELAIELIPTTTITKTPTTVPIRTTSKKTAAFLLNLNQG